ERASTLGRHTEHPLDAEASRPGAAGAGRAARTAHSHRRLLRVRAGSLPPGRLAALIRPRLPTPSGLARDSPAALDERQRAPARGDAELHLVGVTVERDVEILVFGPEPHTGALHRPMVEGRHGLGRIADPFRDSLHEVRTRRVRRRRNQLQAADMHRLVTTLQPQERLVHGAERFHEAFPARDRQRASRLFGLIKYFWPIAILP